MLITIEIRPLTSNATAFKSKGEEAAVTEHPGPVQ